ncbi:MAG: hypothetical protein RIS43_972 [Actinomycetota bacterium]|jgi:starch synthase
MRTAIVTREWPPEVYGGAGVHVTELVKALKQVTEVNVFCMGNERSDATAFPLLTSSEMNQALSVVHTDVAMANAVANGAFDVVHSHTWYANLAGHLAAQTAGIPHVLTAHSLEPRRPWKAEQLGGGYRISSWIEAETYRAADAIIAVSEGMRADVLDCYPFVDPNKVHVVHNGIDSDYFTPTSNETELRSLGIDPARPYVLFVGRITRQKGLIHLLRAAANLPRDVQLVLAASSPDEKHIGEEVSAAVHTLKESRPDDVVWIETMVSKNQLRILLSHATVFACPSIYEPLGIVNLEAMACGTPVVASAVGGIPEVVVNGETGLLVEYNSDDVASFESNIAASLNELLDNPSLCASMGAAGRKRAVENFGWSAIAQRTLNIYEKVAQ